MPANLIDLSASSEYVSSDVVLDSSADSVDSAGFFRRFADHMRAATRSRDTGWSRDQSASRDAAAVYCKGVTDYSFSQSPTVDNPSSSSPVNRSILVQAGFDPADSGDEGPAEIGRNDSDPTLIIPARPLPARVHSAISASVTTTPPTSSASKASGRKRWSDFGTRLVGFVDKILLPEVEKKAPASSAMPSGHRGPSVRRSGSDEQLCSLTAAHAISRRSAARCLSNQSDASDVIQMYSDIGRLQRDAVTEDDSAHTVTALRHSLQNTPDDTAGQLFNDPILR